jgi:hypothetical protein
VAGSFGYRYGNGSASSLPLRIALPNTAYVTNIYDSVARLQGTWLMKSDGVTILDCAVYGYDLAGQRKACTNTVNWLTNAYDGIGQLKIASASPIPPTYGYFYDAAWNLNRRTNNGVTATFTVDSRNQLVSAAGVAEFYDSNGNLIASGTATNKAYVYDDENRLIQWFSYANGIASPANGDLRTDLVYDGLGRLRKRLEYFYNPGSSPSGPGPLLSGSWTLSSETR